MITLTDIAKQKIKEIAINEGIKPSIRMKILGGGCSGYKFDMEFDEISSTSDELITQDDITILIDEMSFQYLDGSTVDYTEGLYSSGFKLLSENIKGTCGCGSSMAF